MKTLYRLEQSGDCEGRTMRTVGYFTTKALADRVGASNFGNHAMGGNQARVTEVVVYSTLEEFIQSNPTARALFTPGAEQKRLRETALAKLTLAERDALGLKG